MKNKLLIAMMACVSLAFFSCEKKTEIAPSEETPSKIDDAIKATKLTPEAKAAAKEITADNVDAEAAALLKEIENDDF